MLYCDVVHRLGKAFFTDKIPYGFTAWSYVYFHIVTPCSRVLLEKLTGSQLVKKFPAFYGT